MGTGTRGERGAVSAQGAGRRMLVAALALWAAVPVGLAAQAERLSCSTGQPVGSLGITGIKCDRCQFYTNGEVHRAVFWTEPTIEALNAKIKAAAVLKPGDVLVAVDGQLITTKEGSARFSDLPASGNVTLRIRRDGQLRDMSVPVTAVCPSAKGAEAPKVAGRPLPAMAPPPRLPAKGTPERLVPPPPMEALSPAAPAGVPLPAPAKSAPPPPPPAPDAMLPRAELGFAFSCRCTYESRDGGRWTFPEPPVVFGVSAGAGEAAGLRQGDRILEVNGKDITTPDGARAFGAIRPGDHPRWTVERDGKQAVVVTVARKQATVSARTVASEKVDFSRAPLRFSGAVGNTFVEVRGGKVNVMMTQGDSLVIIRTGDAEIRLSVPSSGGGGAGGKGPPPSREPGGR